MYKKLFLLLGIGFIIYGCSKPKENNNYGVKNDSVEKYLKLADNFEFPNNIRNQYNKKALSFVDFDNIDSTALRYIFKVTQVNIRTGNLEEYKKNSLLQLKYSLKNKDTLSLARYYRVRGSYYKDKDVFDSAFFYYNKSEKYYNKSENSNNELSYLLYNKSHIQEVYGDYTGAILSASQSLLLLNDSKNYKLIYDDLTILGNLEHILKNYDEAIKYHQQAYKLLLKNNINSFQKTYNQLSSTLNNIGNSYREMGNYKIAIYYFKKALKEESKKNQDPELKAYVYNNLGFVFLKEKKYQNLPILFERAAVIFDSVKNYNECAISNMYLSDYYLQIKDTVKAISFSNKALRLVEKNKGSDYYLTVLSNAGRVNKNKAPQYIADYHKVNDSLLFQERKNRSLFHKIELETDVIQKEKDLAISQKRLYLLSLSLILFIVILLFVIFYQKAKKKELVLLKEQQVTNQELFYLIQQQQEISEQVKQKEKKRIALELHDNIMNKLASTRFNLFSLSKKADKEAIDKALIHIENIKEIEDEIRNITYDLSNDYFLNNQEYKSLIEQFYNNQNSLLGIKYILEYDDLLNLEQLSNLKKLNLYRILQETANNINKHSKATQAIISLIKEEETVLISIEDNGKGFDVTIKHHGIGLKNIKQRVTLLKGKISIQSNLNLGTKIFISFPF